MIFWPVLSDGRTSQLRPGWPRECSLGSSPPTMRPCAVLEWSAPCPSHWTPPPQPPGSHLAAPHRGGRRLGGRRRLRNHGQGGKWRHLVRGGGAGGAASSPWGVDATRFRLILERARTSCPFLVCSRVRVRLLKYHDFRLPRASHAQRPQLGAHPRAACRRALPFSAFAVCDATSFFSYI